MVESNPHKPEAPYYYVPGNSRPFIPVERLPEKSSKKMTFFLRAGVAAIQKSSITAK